MGLKTRAWITVGITVFLFFSCKISSENKDDINKTTQHADGLDTRVQELNTEPKDTIPQSKAVAKIVRHEEQKKTIEEETVSSKISKTIQDKFSDLKFSNTVKLKNSYLKIGQSKTSLVYSLLVYFDAKGNLKKEINLNKHNPNRAYIDTLNYNTSYHQIAGYNHQINSSKANLSLDIPPLLEKYVKEDYHISTINPSIYPYISNDKRSTIVVYSYDLLPAREILEHVNFPGISGIMIIDNETAEIVKEPEIFPFKINDVRISEGRDFLVFTHLQNIKDKAFSVKEEDWLHFASVFSIEKGEIVKTEKGKDQCSILEAGSKIVGYACFDNMRFQETRVENFILNQKLYSIKLSTKDGLLIKNESTSTYQTYIKEDNTKYKLYYEKDFEILDLD